MPQKSPGASKYFAQTYHIDDTLNRSHSIHSWVDAVRAHKVSMTTAGCVEEFLFGRLKGSQSPCYEDSPGGKVGPMLLVDVLL